MTEIQEYQEYAHECRERGLRPKDFTDWQDARRDEADEQA